MPRKTPLIRQRKHYSRDLKRIVIYQRHVLAKKPTEIAIDLDIPLRVVQRVIKTWKNIGEVCQDRTGPERRLILTSIQCQVCYHLFSGRNVLT